LAECWYKTTFHTSSKKFPFMALYGYYPPSIISPLKGTTKVQAVEDHIGHQQEVLKLLKDNLVITQNRMKQQEDQHHSEREFEVGDWVFLRLQPYKYMSLKQQKKDNKLTPKYYGPIRCCRGLEVWLTNWKLSSIFTCTSSLPCFLLKEVMSDKIPIQTILPEINEEGKIILEPKTILETRIKSCEIEQLLSTSSNGRTYQWKRRHGKMSSSCRNTRCQVLRKTLVWRGGAC
jgi:hypothetical protein